MSHVLAHHLQRARSTHTSVGFCEFQGRRPNHEDSHILQPIFPNPSLPAPEFPQRINRDYKNPELEKRPKGSISIDYQQGQTALFGIFDGHASSTPSDFAAKHLFARLHRIASTTSRREGDPLIDSYLSLAERLSEEEISNAFIDCEQAYLRGTGGTTACLVMTERLPASQRLSPDQAASSSSAQTTKENPVKPKYFVRIVNLGDSRGILVRRRLDQTTGLHTASIALETIDHKPENPSELERIRQAGVAIQNGRLLGNSSVSRTIGDFVLKQNKSLSPAQQACSCVPEIFTTYDAEEGDYIILACDGLFEVFDSEELLRVIEEKITQQIREREGHDISLSLSHSEIDLARICKEVIDMCYTGVFKLPPKPQFTDIIDASSMPAIERPVVEELVQSGDNMSLMLIVLQGNVGSGEYKRDELIVGDYFDYVPLSLPETVLVGVETQIETASPSAASVTIRKAYETFFSQVGYASYVDPSKCKKKTNGGSSGGKKGKGKEEGVIDLEEECRRLMAALKVEAREKEKEEHAKNRKEKGCRCERVWKKEEDWYVCSCCI